MTDSPQYDSNPFQSPKTVARAPAAPSTRLQRRPVVMMAAGILFGMLCGAMSGAMAFPLLTAGAYLMRPPATDQQRIIRPSNAGEFTRVIAAGSVLGAIFGAAYGGVMGAILGILYGAVRRVDRHNIFWQAALVSAGGAGCLMALVGFTIARYGDNSISPFLQFIGFTLTGLATGLGSGVGAALFLKATALRWRDAIVVDAEMAE
jgi:hypothetical protein